MPEMRQETGIPSLSNLSSLKEHRLQSIENGLADAAQEGEHGTNGQSTLSGVRWIASEKLLCSAGSPILHFLMTWRNGMGREEGR